ncbi:GNAT family N-acetyltransferase [Paenibacillus sepulcri]|uniref:GNAT family N-acetyltransferase n=1 Tax=Paenibacillus sepulcri TaxID=359917 RepID=A0ABS7C1A2_9BACL|nr:GNAT family N-acetyltransferase [Paenibacillus sepulcri]
MYNFVPMTRQTAEIISGWTYPHPYSIYSMDGSEECIGELMNGDYFYAKDKDSFNPLVGFACCGHSARVPGGYAAGIYNDPDRLDIGLGLRPDRTGKGLGSDFLAQSVQFMSRQFEISKFQLVVVAFNERAINAYEKAGFQQEELFESGADEHQIPFVVMRCSI